MYTFKKLAFSDIIYKLKYAILQKGRRGHYYMTNREKASINIGVETLVAVENDGVAMLGDDTDKLKQRPKLMMHSCCGPCSTAVIERLLGEYDITIFFYNPNITDAEEYAKRRDTQIEFIEAFNEKVNPEDKVTFLEGEYFPAEFFSAAKGLEDEPEGGARCTECFKLRLERTAAQAKLMGYDYFGTTLTVSPHKNYPLISEIGNEISASYGLAFLDMDFKKKAGYQRSVALSKEYGLYRQNYCGCGFSKWY